MRCDREGIAADLLCAYDVRRFHEAATLLADRLLRLCNSAESTSNANITTPSPMPKAFFSHSGSDANNTFLKLVPLHFLTVDQPRRTKFLSCMDSYHGMTLSTASLSGLPGYHRNFYLLNLSFLHASAPVFDVLARWGFLSEEAYVEFSADEIEGAIAAFCVVPVMAVGGILPPTGDVLSADQDRAGPT